MCRPYSPPSRLVVFHSLFIHFNSRWSMMILYRDIWSISPGYLIFRMSTFSSLVFLFFSLAVIAGRAKPQQPSQQSGRTALSGKQERVREEGDGHRGAELGGCLSSSCSLLFSPSPTLHHPSTSVSHFYLIEKKNQEKRKHSNYIRRT